MKLTSEEVSNLEKNFCNKLGSQLEAAKFFNLSFFRELVDKLQLEIVPQTYEDLQNLVFKILYSNLLANSCCITDEQPDFLITIVSHNSS